MQLEDSPQDSGLFTDNARKEVRLLGLLGNTLAFLSFGIFFGGFGFIIADETTRWLLGLDPYSLASILTGWLGGLVGFAIVGVIAGILGVRFTKWVAKTIYLAVARFWEKL